MTIDAGRVALTDSEREAIALALSDALVPYGRPYFEAAEAARLLEARLSVLLAARGERGYHEAWALRGGLTCNAPDCRRTPGHMGPHHA